MDLTASGKGAPRRERTQKQLREVAIVLLGIVLGQALIFGPSLVGRKILLPLDVLAGPGIYIPRTPEIEKIEQRDWSRVDQIYFEPLRLASLAEVQAHQQAGEILVGPEVTKWFPAGRLVFPRAAMLAKLALNRTEFVSAQNLEPIYLRQTQFVKAPPPRIVP